MEAATENAKQTSIANALHIQTHNGEHELDIHLHTFARMCHMLLWATSKNQKFAVLVYQNPSAKELDKH